MTQRTKMKPVGCSLDRCIAFFIDSILSFIPFYSECWGCSWRDAIRDGKSIGKGVMGLRVVKMDGSKPGCLASCLRNFCMLPPIGWICILFSSEKRHLGDLIAGTMVIEDS